MFYLYVQVLAAFRAEEFSATIVWANEGAVNLLRRPPQMLLPFIFVLVVGYGRNAATDDLLVSCSRLTVLLPVGIALNSLLLLKHLSSELTFSGLLEQFLLVLLLA